MDKHKPALTRTAVEAAAIVLGVLESVDTVTKETVIAAYRKALRDVHPDLNEIPLAEVGNKIFAARIARDLLLEWIELKPDPNCVICQGTGHVRGLAFGSRTCPRCTQEKR